MRLFTPFVAMSLAAFAVGTLARAFFIAFAPFEAGDSSEYVRIAKHLLAGDGFSIHGGSPTAFRPPAYPLFVAAVYAIGGPFDGLVLAAQAVLGGIATWLIFLLGRRLLDERVAFGGALLAGAQPHLAFYAATVLSETLSFVLIAGAMLAVSHALPALRDWRPLLIAGSSFGMAALSSPRLAALPAAVALLFAWHRPGVRRWATAAGVLAAGYLMAAGPWMTRNVVELGTPAPLTVGQGGLNLWLSAARVAPYDYRLGEWARTEPLVARWLELYDGPAARREREHMADRLALEEQLTRQAWRRILDDPAGYVAYRLRVIPGLWIQPAIYAGMFQAPFEQQNDRLDVMVARGHWGAALLRLGSITVFTAGLFAGVALGVWALRRRPLTLGLLLLPALYVTVVHSLLLAEQRYSILAQPFLWLVAATGWAAVARNARQRIRSSHE